MVGKSSGTRMVVPENSVPSARPGVVVDDELDEPDEQAPASRPSTARMASSTVRLRFMWFPLVCGGGPHGATTWMVPVMPAVAVPWIEQ